MLCTARDIITLWVSRMVMFNAYFLSDAGDDEDAQSPRMESVGFSSRRGELPLPFQDVYIHPMIQDGAGQRMSKSLGNGVDPMDIIHSHGADAMRFTLASMATQTQDARLPVDCVDPHTGEAFEPETVTLPNGAKVAAPIQERNGKKMVTSYGYSSGKAVPSEPGGEMPLARNTSEKFDLGQRLCNKLWNACRFAFSYLEGAEGPRGRGAEGERRARFSGRAEDPATKPTPARPPVPLDPLAAGPHRFAVRNRDRRVPLQRLRRDGLRLLLAGPVRLVHRGGEADAAGRRGAAGRADGRASMRRCG